tara:strand:- start:94 stop:345 length:252 start_codon:yes stop_codon:yes gene_type:complete
MAAEDEDSADSASDSSDTVAAAAWGALALTFDRSASPTAAAAQPSGLLTEVAAVAAALAAPELFVPFVPLDAGGIWKGRGGEA